MTTTVTKQHMLIMAAATIQGREPDGTTHERDGDILCYTFDVTTALSDDDEERCRLYLLSGSPVDVNASGVDCRSPSTMR